MVLCIALLSSAVVAPAAAQSETERFLVELDAAGDADVSVSFTYDLDGETERAAFEELRANETAQERVIERFENRMAAVAEDTAEATGREMSVSDARIDFRRDGDIGTIAVSIAWSNLAAIDGDRLAVTEPFASGFDPDRALTVSAPDGYTVASAEPSPTRSDDTSVTWDADRDLDAFEVVAERTNPDRTDGDPDGDATDDAAGFGAVVAALALSTAAILAIRD